MFLEDVVSEYTADQNIHVILDNYCTHNINDAWLEKYSNVHFHYTPTSASWLNQVEIWFGIFSRKALRGASFTSPAQLRPKIEAYIAHYNPIFKPFKWEKREVVGSQFKYDIQYLNKQ